MSLLRNEMLMNVAGPLLAYLLGAVPFGYLIFRAVKGVDIRTVGSGNIGATNVGRQLGFRYFLLVFALDLLKGFLPTWGIPAALKALGVSPTAELPVLVALATILGHNFPVYLGFKGGKGVATSLGALLALDPIACGAAALGFFAIFALTRIVSFSSIAGALAFVAGYLVRVDAPWSPENRPMTLLSIGIAALLILRHRKNLVRIVQGTEPRVPLRRPKDEDRDSRHPSGKIQPLLVVGIAVGTLVLVGAAVWISRRAGTPIEGVAGPWALNETHRELTGQQRASRLAFADRGRTLAVMCPRYNKVLLYRVTPEDTLEAGPEIDLEGRPVAIATAGDRLVALQRPPGDDKHLGPGWWQAFDLDGQPLGDRVPAGYYPDDCAATPDGRFVLVVSSGRAEGDATKPMPAIEVFPLDVRAGASSPVSRLELDAEHDPDRLRLSASGARGLVVMRRSNRALALDLAQADAPRVAGHVELETTKSPHVSRSDDGDWILMPTGSETEAVGLPAPFPESDASSTATHVAYLRPDESTLGIAQISPRLEIGRLPIMGPFNLGGTRPIGLALSVERGLLAVATKPGAVHLIAFRSRLVQASTAAANRVVR